MSGQESLRAAASRDEGFLGLDIIAMAHLIQQMNSAGDAISAWLRTNATLPPSVPRTGLRQAAAVQTWVNGQPGMLSRRRNYAVTHLGANGRSIPHPGAPKAMPTTHAGAGHHVGTFPDVRSAMRAGAKDAASVQNAHAVPDEVWKRLLANADDPDYAHGLYRHPAAAVAIIKGALKDRDHLKAVETSLGVASHQMAMNERWLRPLLDDADREGIRDDVVHVLARAGLDHRAKVALGHIGLTHLAAHRFPGPNPPHATHEAMIAPAAEDPYAASELYGRHPDAFRQALRHHPDSGPLARLLSNAEAMP